MRRLHKALLFGTLLIIPIAGVTMSMFGAKCMFSAVTGVVTQGGKPVAGAEVVRSYQWQGPDKTDKETAQTGADGRFSFDVATASSGWSLFPHNPSILQEIHIRYQGKDYEAYMLRKNDYEVNSELGGRKLDLVCDLGGEPDHHDGFYGICQLAK
jgi:hypothetical protein